MELLEGLDALRRDEPFNGFCEAAAALEGSAAAEHTACHLLRQAREAALAVRADAIVAAGVTGPAVGAALQRQLAAAELSCTPVHAWGELSTH